MISRRTARLLGEVYARVFVKEDIDGQHLIDGDELYAFLFDREDRPSWFCSAVKGYHNSGVRYLAHMIMEIHTGETLVREAPGLGEKRQEVSQKLLMDLAEDILNYYLWSEDPSPALSSQKRKELFAPVEDLLESLKLSGYVHKDGRLLPPESDVFDTQEAAGVISSLYGELELDNAPTLLEVLRHSEEYWNAKKWRDCIHNSRLVLDGVLRESAAAYSSRVKGPDLPRGTYKNATHVRDYLEREGLVEAQEKTAIKEVYGLLSGTGSHPYMAQEDQARLLRQMALVLAQFVLLRLRGALEAAGA